MNKAHEQFLDMMRIAMEANERGGCAVFAHYSPHTDSLCVQLFENEWRDGAQPQQHFTLYANGLCDAQAANNPAVCLQALRAACTNDAREQ